MSMAADVPAKKLKRQNFNSEIDIGTLIVPQTFEKNCHVGTEEVQIECKSNCLILEKRC